MGAQYETLIEIKKVTDHDCGNYKIGEIDFGIRGTLTAYLEKYGYEGKKDILHILGVVAGQVNEEFLRIAQNQNPIYKDSEG